jgi:peptidoglycan/xylan/chitin deacetylase (PgdA/CDA1 family)
MLGEMQSAGIILGSHTRTHAVLTNEAEEKVIEETMGSREMAEHHCGAEIRHFAYPDGCFNTTVVNAVAAAGYRSAYTTCRHRSSTYPQFTIPRRLFWEKSCVDAWGRFSPSVMSCQVNGVFDGLNRCRLVHAH